MAETIKLTPEQEIRRRAILKARDTVTLAQIALGELACGRDSHVAGQRGDSAVCLICGTDLGWFCPTSPTKSCEYSDNPDSCIHCGDPDERK